MKAITIHHPWASLIACGEKRIETRSWPTKYRGEIAIHAGIKPIPRDYYGIRDLLPCVCDFPYGKVIAIAELVDCLQVSATFNDTGPFSAMLENLRSINGKEFMFGDYTPGRYAWILANVRRIEPVPAKGMQRLWEWDEKGLRYAYAN